MKKLENRVLRDIGALSRMIQTMSDTAFREFNLQKGQFVFITRVCENPGINHIHLSQLLYVDKGTTTKAIQKLVKIGYIEKKQDSSDSRIHRLYPTPLALEVYEKLLETENSFISQSFQGFSSAERQRATDLILKMRTNMEQEWEILKNREKEG